MAKATTKKKPRVRKTIALQASITDREQEILDQIKAEEEAEGSVQTTSSIIRAVLNELGVEGVRKLLPKRY